VTRTADTTSDPGYRQRFGSYAGLAEAELTTYRDLDDEAPDHANSNTARTAPAEEGTVVVPFPAPAAAPASFAERIATALASEPMPASADSRPTIGIELRRETATFRVPVSEASLPEALMKLAGGSLRIEGDTPVLAQLEPSAAPSSPEISREETRAIALYDESIPQEFDGLDFEPPRVLRRMVE
jgi:hypothetical protein